MRLSWGTGGFWCGIPGPAGQGSKAERLGSLLRKTEEDRAFVECFDGVTNTCPEAGHCRLKGILGEALREFYASLDRYTLPDLVTGPQQENLARILLGAPPR